MNFKIGMKLLFMINTETLANALLLYQYVRKVFIDFYHFNFTYVNVSNKIR